MLMLPEDITILGKIWNYMLYVNIDQTYLKVENPRMILKFLVHNFLKKYHIFIVPVFSITTSKKQYSSS